MKGGVTRIQGARGDVACRLCCLPMLLLSAARVLFACATTGLVDSAHIRPKLQCIIASYPRVKTSNQPSAPRVMNKASRHGSRVAYNSACPRCTPSVPASSTSSPVRDSGGAHSATPSVPKAHPVARGLSAIRCSEAHVTIGHAAAARPCIVRRGRAMSARSVCAFAQWWGT